mgnify:FL=1
MGCTATSRLILHEDIHDEFVERLVRAASTLIVGNGTLPATQVGPVINTKQLEKILHYIDIGMGEATCVLGGKRDTDGDKAYGTFVKPTIFTNVSRAARIFREEIFGPVLSVTKCTSLEHAIDLVNDSAYGLSSSIYTRDVNAAFVAVRELETGITYINAPTIGAEAHMPFGGVKGTGNGHREGGWTVFDIFTEWKSVYIDYSGKLQRAQIDNYDN